MNRENAVGLMGGSFDPIHLGHIAIAKAALDAFSLSRVLFLPSGRPPHKAHLGASAEDRLEMTNLATSQLPWAETSDIEVFREGTVYTVDTLHLLKKQAPDMDFYYIIGADTLLDLKNWKSTQEIAGLCTFICVRRPGIATEQMERERDILLEHFHLSVLFAEAQGPAVSSTVIRERIREGSSTNGMLPESVRDYITKKKLYL